MERSLRSTALACVASSLLLTGALAFARRAARPARGPAPTPAALARALARPSAGAQGVPPGPALPGRRQAADRSPEGLVYAFADATYGTQLTVTDLGHAWLFHAGPYVPVDALGFLTDPRRLGGVELRVTTPLGATVHEFERIGDSCFALVPRAALPAATALGTRLAFWDDRAEPADAGQAFLVLEGELTLR